MFKLFNIQHSKISVNEVDIKMFSTLSTKVLQGYQRDRYLHDNTTIIAEIYGNK